MTGTYVMVVRGKNVGKLGRINGELHERKATLTEAGKVQVRFKDNSHPYEFGVYTLANLREATVLEIQMYERAGKI